MTEAEWLACTDPKGMVEFVDKNASDRKKRLFAVACCRRIWSEITDPRGQTAVEVAERFADGLASRSEREAAIQAVSATSQENRELMWGDPDAAEGPGGTWNVPFYDALQATAVICGTDELATIDGVYREATRRPGRRFKRKTDWKPNTEHMPEEGMDTSDLIRELFGNPFRPVILDAAWLTTTVVSLAQAIYNDRAFERLPILADALEEAGCDNADILSHLRTGGEHVRGCWAIDLLLGKE